MFDWNRPYEESDPQEIRADFAELTITDEDNTFSAHLLHKLACYLPTDTLRSFMDDLAMERV